MTAVPDLPPVKRGETLLMPKLVPKGHQPLFSGSLWEGCSASSLPQFPQGRATALLCLSVFVPTYL